MRNGRIIYSATHAVIQAEGSDTATLSELEYTPNGVNFVNAVKFWTLADALIAGGMYDEYMGWNDAPAES